MTFDIGEQIRTQGYATIPAGDGEVACMLMKDNARLESKVMVNFSQSNYSIDGKELTGLAWFGYQKLTDSWELINDSIEIKGAADSSLDKSQEERVFSEVGAAATLLVESEYVRGKTLEWAQSEVEKRSEVVENAQRLLDQAIAARDHAQKRLDRFGSE